MVKVPLVDRTCFLNSGTNCTIIVNHYAYAYIPSLKEANYVAGRLAIGYARAGLTSAC